MPKVKDIAAYFEGLVPSEMKLEFDNVGLLVGMEETPVTKALVALDITPEVIDEAIENGAQMILSHHPLFFDLKQVTDSDSTGAKMVKLIQNGVSCLCQHTNLDQVEGGVNSALAVALGIEVEGFLGESFTATNGAVYGMGRYGSLAETTDMPRFLPFVKSALNTSGVRYHAASRPVRRVAVCGGTGGEFIEAAIAKGCDTLVTADIKYHQFLAAKALGLNVIDADHFCTENVVTPVLAELVKKGFPELQVEISKALAQTVRFG